MVLKLFYPPSNLPSQDSTQIYSYISLVFQINGFLNVIAKLRCLLPPMMINAQSTAAPYITSPSILNEMYK